MQEVLFRDIGKMDYRRAWDYQEMLLQQNVSIKTEARIALSHQQSDNHLNEKNDRSLDRKQSTVNYLLLLEHPPVYTLGKSGKEENVLITGQQMLEKGIEFFKTNRGGDITFHGPGQLVGYPILDLENFYTDIGRYLRNLEQVIINTLAEYNLHAGRSPGETGVWLDPGVKGSERKICAIGVRCSRWITMHGFAFNINTDLGYFDNIIPCGIRDKQVTSLQKELEKKTDMQEVKDKVKRNFEEVFEVSLVNYEL